MKYKYNGQWLTIPTGGGGTTVIANPTLIGTEDNLESIQIGDNKFKVDANIINSGMHIHTDGFNSPDYDRVLTTITTAGASYTATEDCWIIGTITKSSTDTFECQVLIDGNIVGTSFIWTSAGTNASVVTIFVPVKMNSIITTRNSVGQYNLTVYGNKSVVNIESQLAADAHIENNQDIAVGTIIPFFGTTAPAHYLACDGSVYNISAYPALAEFIKDEFGSYNYFGGDGTTTFGVPDLRGEFLRGTGTNSHTEQGNGSNVGTHQNATNQIAAIGGSSNQLTFKGLDIQRAVTDPDVVSATSTQFFIGTNSTYNIGRAMASAFTSRPTNTSVLWCIKAEPIYYLVNQIENATIATLDKYSTDEKCIGCWIDGKPLYRKVINITITHDSSQQYKLNVSSLNVDKGIKLYGTDSNGGTIPIILTQTLPWCVSVIYDGVTKEIIFSCGTSVSRTASYNIIFEYTKTTDAPNSFSIDMLSNVQDLVLTAAEVQSTIDSIEV